MEVKVTLLDACGYEYSDSVTYDVGLTNLRTTAMLVQLDEPIDTERKSMLDRFRKTSGKD